MPTAEDMDRKYSAEFQLFKGSHSQHEERLRSDPAYRAADQAKNESDLRSAAHSGYAVGEMEFDRKQRRIHYLPFNMTKAVRDEEGHIDGEIAYNTKTGKMTIRFLPR